MNALPPVPQPNITQQDTLLPPWQSWFQQLLNSLPFMYKASFQMETGVATTVYEISTTAGNGGRYELAAWVDSGDAAGYTAFATLMVEGSSTASARLVNPTGGNGANLTFTLSGQNVQCTQTSGSSQKVNFSYLRIG
jgi:hypothetical protein